MKRIPMKICLALVLMLPALASTWGVAQPAGHPLFVTHENCVACHNGLETPQGQDVSLGLDWSATMMANSARDPYWQAAVRRETMDHPEASAAIQNECSACHMPMARFSANSQGDLGQVFAHLPLSTTGDALSELAEDGVSCSLCHQITAEGLGEPESFVAGFHIATALASGERPLFGPFDTDTGRREVMNSAAGFSPREGTHLQSSELCASCHTLITEALGEGGRHIGELPEQMPYQEWLNSSFAGTQSCQDCHMPEVEGLMPVTAVLGQPRERFSRHDFLGGNFFMLRMLNRYRNELAVKASPQALDRAAERTVEHLREAAADLSIKEIAVTDGRLEAVLEVSNKAGHKFPTAYPSRRAWLRVTVRDGGGNTLFESGRFLASGAIAGNDNDRDPGLYEPHYAVIEDPGQVQIYEGILAGEDGQVTTGLLTATHYLKDNRLLPRGFDKSGADEDIAVHGGAAADDDFMGASDSVRYRIALGGAAGPFTLEAALWYQPIAYRWAENLAPYDSAETRRFVDYYRSMSATSAQELLQVQRKVE